MAGKRLVMCGNCKRGAVKACGSCKTGNGKPCTCQPATCTCYWVDSKGNVV